MREATLTQNEGVQPATGMGERLPVDHTSARSRFSATHPVIVLRLVSVVALTIIYVDFWTSDTSAAPDIFSVASWSWMLLPPAVLLVSLFLGLRLRVPHSPRWRLYLSRASAAITALALVLACAFSLLYFVGELFDYAIG